MGVAAMALPAAATTFGAKMAGGKALGLAAGGGLTPVAGSLTTGQQLVMGIANASPIMMGLGGYSMGNYITAEQPQMPDYSGMFGMQQSALSQQQSFTRKNTADLEGLLEYGSTAEKNQAFDELQRRGEDSARLLEIQTRRERTADNQEDIDRYIESATPPTDEEMQGLIASLKASEYRELEEDIDREMTNVKQVMARKGLGSSSAIAQLEARLAEVEQRGKLAIDRDVQDRVLNYQKGVEGIRNEGLNRILKGAGFEDTASRYNLQIGQQERNLQEGLRTSRTQDQNALGLEKFRAEVQGLNNQFVQETQAQQNQAMLGLGALGMGMQYFGGNQGSGTTAPKTSVPYVQPTASFPMSNPSDPYNVGFPYEPIKTSNYLGDDFGRMGIEPNPNRF